RGGLRTRDGAHRDEAEAPGQLVREVDRRQAQADEDDEQHEGRRELLGGRAAEQRGRDRERGEPGGRRRGDLGAAQGYGARGQRNARRDDHGSGGEDARRQPVEQRDGDDGRDDG